MLEGGRSHPAVGGVGVSLAADVRQIRSRYARRPSQADGGAVSVSSRQTAGHSRASGMGTRLGIGVSSQCKRVVGEPSPPSPWQWSDRREQEHCNSSVREFTRSSIVLF